MIRKLLLMLVLLGFAAVHAGAASPPACHTTYGTVNAIICQDHNYVYHGKTFTSAGSYTVKLKNKTGCDSMVTLNLTYVATVTNAVSVSICNGQTYTDGGGNIYRTAGIYSATLTAASGCDSVNTLTLRIKPGSYTEIDTVICKGQTVLLDSIAYTTSGIYVIHLTNSLGCDSAITLNLNVLDTSSTSINATICSNQVYTINGISYSTAGTYNVHLTNAAGCDSLVILNLAVNNTSAGTTVNASICSGQTYTIGVSGFTSTGTYIDTLLNKAGCDSIITLNLTVIAPVYSTVTASMCGGSYTYHGTTYSAGGTYTQHITAQSGCDSIVTLTLKPYTSIFSKAACVGDNLTVNVIGATKIEWLRNNTVVRTQTVAPSGTVVAGRRMVTDSAHALDSTYLNTLYGGVYVDKHKNVFVGEHSCVIKWAPGATYGTVVAGIRGVDPSSPGPHYYDSACIFGSAEGLIVDDSDNVYVAEGTAITKWAPGAKYGKVVVGTRHNFTNYNDSNTIGEQIILGADKNFYTSTGPRILKWTPGAKSGTLYAGTKFGQTATSTSYTGLHGICMDKNGNVYCTPNNDGHLAKFAPGAVNSVAVLSNDNLDSLTLGGASSLFIDNKLNIYSFKGYGGTQNLGNNKVIDRGTVGVEKFVPPYNTPAKFVAGSSKQGYDILNYFQYLNSSEIHMEGFMFVDTAGGSLYLTEPYFVTRWPLTAPDSLAGEYTYYTTDVGNYLVRVTYLNGACHSDSMVYSIHNATSSNVTINVCKGHPYTFHGQAYAVAGNYIVHDTNHFHCDSIINLQVIVHDSSFTKNYTTCNNAPYLYNGTTYTATGTYRVHLYNSFGCDSIINLHLKVYDTSSTVLNPTICSDQYYTAGNRRFNIAGTYVVIVSNSQYCDSTITVNLSVKPISRTTVYDTTCADKPVVYNNRSYATPGTYNVVLQNSIGCDSIISHILYVKSTSATTLITSICSNKSYTFNGNTYTTAGIYTATLSNKIGCDSVVTLNLSVHDTSAKTINASICSDKSYSFNGSTYTTAGTYIAKLTNKAGCDSVVTLNLTVKNISASTVNATICSDKPYAFNGHTYNTTGTYTATLTNSIGCDSVVTLYLNVKSISTTTINASICRGKSYTFNGNTYSTTGTYRTTLTNAIGCDSIITLNLNVYTITSSVSASICSGSSYTFNGSTYTTTGAYSVTLSNSAGCDSVVTLHLTVIYPVNTVIKGALCGGSYTYNGTTYTTAGTYTYHHTSYLGCDSVVTLVVSSYTSSFSHSGHGCLGDSMTVNVLGAHKIEWIRNGKVVNSVSGGRFGTIVAGHKPPYYSYRPGDANYSDSTSLFGPEGMTVDKNGDLYLTGPGCIFKWTKGAKHSTVVAGKIGNQPLNTKDTTYLLPYDVKVDDSSNLYIADYWSNSVLKWKQGATSGKVVAGKKTFLGLFQNIDIKDSTRLYTPSRLCLDKDKNIFVGDYYNRIRKWAPGATYGTTVAGGDAYYGDSTGYAAIGDFVLDASNNIYETNNDYITVWTPGASHSHFLYGDLKNVLNRMGPDSTHPQTAYSIGIDGHKNLYTFNTTANTIQKWAPGYTHGTTIAGKISSDTTHFHDSTYMYEPDRFVLDTNGGYIYVIEGYGQYITRWPLTNNPDSLSGKFTYQADSAGTYTIRVTYLSGTCSNATYSYTVKPSSYTSVTGSICSNQSYTFNGSTYSTTGTYTTKLTNSVGCDSIITLHLTVRNTSTSTVNASTCSNKTYSFNGNTYNTAGTYTATLTNSVGCDSVITLNLTVKNTSATTVNASICSNRSYSFNGSTYTTAGTYTATLTNSVGCDSVVTLYLTVNNTSASTVNASVCSNKSYSFNGSTYTTAGTYTAKLTNKAGCDSVVTLNLSVNNTSASTVNAAICSNKPYNFNGSTYNTAGTYTATLTNKAGCDSVVTLNLSVKNSSASTVNAAICSNKSYSFNGSTYTTAGAYTATLTNSLGCDSVVTLNLSVNNTSATTVNASICSNKTYSFNGSTYTTAGTYIATLTNSIGCDSVITLHLTVNNTSSSTVNASTCSNKSYSFNGSTYTAAGTYTATLTNKAGCDSVVTLNLTVKNTTTSTVSASICSNKTYSFNGSTYNTAGTYTATLTNKAGCDSVVTLNLTVKNTTASTVNASICSNKSYSFNGSTYTTAGTYTATLTNKAGCDSVITLNLTLKNTSSSTVNASICSNKSYSFNGSTYTAAGTYTATLTNNAGCDSVVTLNLTVKGTSASTVNASICSNKTYSFNGSTYNTAGTYTATLTNKVGCDSVVTLHLTVKNTSSKSITASICSNQSYSFNGNTYNSTGMYTATLTNKVGCDSVVTLNLTVLPQVTPSVTIASSPSSYAVYTKVTFTASPTNGGSTPSYQWKKNGTNVGVNSSSYIDSTLDNGDTITCTLTSNAPCVTVATATSNKIGVKLANSCGPIVLTLTATGSTSAVAHWTSRTGSYKLYYTNVANVPTFSSVTVTGTNSYTLTGLSSGVTYIAYVVDQGCSNTTSSQAYCNTSGGSCSNTAPSGLTVGAAITSATALWSGNDTTYQVFIAKLGGTFVNYVTHSTSYTFSGLTDSTWYVVYVSNRCGSGYGYSSHLDTFNTKVSCRAPNTITISGVTCHGFNVNWAAIPNVYGYQIYITRTSGAGSPSSINYRVSTNSYALTGASGGIGYSVYVKTRCDANTVSTSSSNTATTTTLTTGCKDLDPAGASIVNFENFEIFPNPNNGQFTINATVANSTLPATVQVLNSIGQLVSMQTVDNNNGIINATITNNQLAAGMYLVKVTIGTETRIRRIIVQK